MIAGESALARELRERGRRAGWEVADPVEAEGSGARS